MKPKHTRFLQLPRSERVSMLDYPQSAFNHLLGGLEAAVLVEGASPELARLLEKAVENAVQYGQKKL